jgi:UPF0755 protein
MNQRKHHSSGRKTFAGRLLGIAILVGSFFIGWLMLDLREDLNTPLMQLETPQAYEVPAGSGLISVAADLGKRGYLRHPRYLAWYARLLGKTDRIVAGEYLLLPGITPLGLLEKITIGDVTRYTLTIPEGWTFHQFMELLRGQPKIAHTLDPALDDAGIMTAIGHAGEHPEGMFFPNTYQFIAGITDVAMLRTAYDAMQQQLQHAWETRAADVPLATPYEALILASIIEKETAVDTERARIAGVFARRLRMKMRLQTDPTVIYGLGLDFDGRLRRRDLLADTPYNTYTRHGLPPTPIALPGAASLRAAVNPAPGEDIFFVSRGDGTHYFSSTLEAHQAAVRKFQLGQADATIQ